MTVPEKSRLDPRCTAGSGACTHAASAAVVAGGSMCGQSGRSERWTDDRSLNFVPKLKVRQRIKPECAPCPEVH